MLAKEFELDLEDYGETLVDFTQGNDIIRYVLELSCLSVEGTLDMGPEIN